MLARRNEGENLVPLLEFIRYIRSLVGHDGGRFPKKVNGLSKSSNLSLPELTFSMRGDACEEESPRSVNDSLGRSTQSFSTETRSTSGSMPLPEDEEKELQPLKRVRIKEESREFVLFESSNFPMEYELISRGAQKGVYLAKFVDLNLSLIGLIPLVAADRVDRKLAKLMMGERCCYLLLGTSLIVTGIVVDVNIREEKMQVSPDRGIDVGVDWIEIYRLYEIPTDLHSIQHSVTDQVKKIVDNALSVSKDDFFLDPS